MRISEEGPDAVMASTTLPAAGVSWMLTFSNRTTPCTAGVLNTAEIQTVAPAGTDSVLKCAGGRHTICLEQAGGGAAGWGGDAGGKPGDGGLAVLGGGLDNEEGGGECCCGGGVVVAGGGDSCTIGPSS